MLAIPKELQQAMRASDGRPLRLTDPETQAEYVLLQAEMYDQLQGFLYIGDCTFCGGDVMEPSIGPIRRRDTYLCCTGFRCMWPR
jgi:hypothetical protein